MESHQRLAGWLDGRMSTEWRMKARDGSATWGSYSTWKKAMWVHFLDGRNAVYIASSTPVVDLNLRESLPLDML